tara:strand:- start:3761 stop:5104 length:1344 start_codon:yes stop_codon:yes gene_type:complete
MTPEQAKAQLWYNGILEWKLRPEQRAFKHGIDDPENTLIVGNISRRLGKSFTLVLYAIEQALKTQQKIRFGSAFLSELEEFIQPAFEYILADCPEDLRPEYKATKKTYKFKNGSEIKLVGLDKNPNGLRGNAINIIIIDEAAYVSNLKYLYTSVIIPATMKQKNIKIIVISTPPESPEHFFVELIKKAQLSPKAFYLCLTIDDISDLDPEEKKRLLDEVGGEHSSTAQREFYCRIIIDAERAIAPAFKPDEHIEWYTNQYIKWGLYGDSGGVRDLTVFLMIGYCHVRRKVLVRDELWFKPHTPTSEIVEAVKARWPDNLQMTRVLDSGGQLQIDYSSLGFPVVQPQKDSFDETLLLVNNSFYNSQVLVHPSCSLLIQTLKGGLTNRNRTDFERTIALGHADAVMAYAYGLRGIDRLTDLRPRPKRSEIFTLPTIDRHEAELEKLKGL